MSRIRANQITNETNNGAPDFPNGITHTGIITTTALANPSGDLTITDLSTINGNFIPGTIFWIKGSVLSHYFNLQIKL